MKKFLTAVVTALTVALLAICFAACGKADYVGTYKFYSMSVSGNGLSMEYKVGETAMGGVAITEDYLVLEVKEDNTFVMSGAMYGGSSQSGTWSDDGGKLCLTIDNETQQATLSGDKLTISETEEGYTSTIVFVKQKDTGSSEEGGDTEENKYVGTYKFDSMTYLLDGNKMTIQVGDPGVTEDMVVMEIKADGTLAMTMYSETKNGTWVESGDGINITINGETLEATLSGKTLTFVQGDETMVLAKVEVVSGGDSGSTGGSTSGSLAQYAGTYKLYSSTVDGMTIIVGQAEGLTADSHVLVLNADGTGTLTLDTYGSITVTAVTWTTSQLVLTTGGTTCPLTFGNNELTYTLVSEYGSSVDGMSEMTISYTLKKV